jgi:hypothetical protein
MFDDKVFVHFEFDDISQKRPTALAAVCGSAECSVSDMTQLHDFCAWLQSLPEKTLTIVTSNHHQGATLIDLVGDNLPQSVVEIVDLPHALADLVRSGCDLLTMRELLTRHNIAFFDCLAETGISSRSALLDARCSKIAFQKIYDESITSLV